MLWLLLCRRVGIDWEADCELVDLARKLEWRVVPVFDHRDARPRILADVKCLILGEGNRRRMVQRVSGYFLAIDKKYSRPALAQSRTFAFEVERYRVLAGCQLGTFPHRTLQIEEVIEEYDLSSIEAPTRPC